MSFYNNITTTVVSAVVLVYLVLLTQQKEFVEGTFNDRVEVDVMYKVPNQDTYYLSPTTGSCTGLWNCMNAMCATSRMFEPSYLGVSFTNKQMYCPAYGSSYVTNPATLKPLFQTNFILTFITLGISAISFVLIFGRVLYNYLCSGTVECCGKNMDSGAIESSCTRKLWLGSTSVSYILGKGLLITLFVTIWIDTIEVFPGVVQGLTNIFNTVLISILILEACHSTYFLNDIFSVGDYQLLTTNDIDNYDNDA